MVRAHEGRSASFSVHQASGPSFFVKRSSTRGSKNTIAHEFDACQALTASSELRPYLVPVVAAQVERGLLVFELVEAPAQPRLTFDAARSVGRALALLHALSPETVPGQLGRPYALSLHRPRLDELPHLSQAALDCLRQIQRSDLSRCLADVHTEWRITGAIHGDIRRANLLLPSDGCLKLVDWELSTAGDAAWDVGCFLGDLMVSLVTSIPISDGREPFKEAGAAHASLAEAQALAQHFWAAYHDGAGATPEAGWMRRVLTMSGARVVVAAVERAQTTSTYDMTMAGLLQAAANTMRDPLAVGREVFGLS